MLFSRSRLGTLAALSCILFRSAIAQDLPRSTAQPGANQTSSSTQVAKEVRPSGSTPFQYKSPVMRKLWEGTASHHALKSSALLKLDDSALPSFRTIPPMYAAGASPFDVALGDFNSDGIQDVVVSANPPVVLLGNGDGTFQSATPIGTISSVPTGAAVADSNRDGKLDVFFAISGAVVVYLGKGDGTFGAGSTVSSGGTNENVLARVLAADVNNDGIVDLITNTDAGLSVLLGNGDGTFQAPIVSTGVVQFMAAADFNQDGRLDLAVTDGFDSLSIMFGNGTGTFTVASTYTVAETVGIDSIAIADYNQDGFLDVALPNGQLFLGKAGGSLRLPKSFPASPNATVVAQIDVDGDGITDLLTASGGESCGQSDFGTLGISRGNGDGTFQPAVFFDFGGCSLSWPFIAIGDLNNDGAPDVVVLSGVNSWFSDTPELSVLVNQGGGVFPVATLNVSGGSGGVAVDDFNRDGNADVVLADGSVYLGNGDGTLRSMTSAALGGVAVATGDFDRGGITDVASAVECVPAGCSGGGQLLIAAGNGSGRFRTAAALPSGGFYAESLAVVDLNNDGNLDIAVLNNCADSGCSAGGSLSIYLGNGARTFSLLNTVSMSSGFPTSLVAGDFNNDGIADLAVGFSAAPFESTVVNVLLGNGDGTFQSPISFFASSRGITNGITALLTKDFNNDGILDLAFAFGGSADGGQSGSIMYGNGDGTFAAGTFIVSGAPQFSVVAADFLGVGALTPVFANSCGDVLDCPGGSLLNATAPDIMLQFLGVGDFNNDGKPDLVGSLQYDLGASVLLNIGAAAEATTTTISPSAPQAYTALQPASFIAQVQHTGPGTPTNAVNFFDNGALIGSAPVDGYGNASIVMALPAGSHFIVPYYAGDSSFAPSNGLGVRAVVSPSATTIALNSNANPSYVNQSVILTASLTSPSGAPFTGTVTLKQAKATLAVLPVVNGQASFTKTFPVSGTYQISATYSGDTNHQAGTSAVLKQVIYKLPAITTTRITTTGDVSYVGQLATFTSTTTSTIGPIPDGETVGFFDGAVPLGTATAARGVAIFTTSALTAKTHTIKATYSGDATFKTSWGTMQQVVVMYPSSITLIASPNPSINKQTVILTATVQSSNPKAPTGTVTFKNGTQTLGSAELNNGLAMLSTSRLPVGSDPIAAIYNGDTATEKSSSQVLTEDID
jgi:hypothetical protein